MSLSPDAWRRAFALFDGAADVPADEQVAWLESAASADSPEIRAAALEMLLLSPGAADELVQQAMASAQAAIQALALDEPEAAPGIRIGPWCLLEEIGRGGMGVVYLAERADHEFEQRVALKRIRRGLDTDDVLARFLRERRILARLQHPNIARLIDGGADADGRPYFAMEHVAGEPITVFAGRVGLSVPGRLRLFLTAARAVEFAHRSLVVHRDLKPSNILVTADGTVKLLDFGIAKLLAGDDAIGQPGTRTELPALTPAYAAPEQIRGEPATTSTDVYGLGAVLYELLTGRRAHESRDESPYSLAQGILESDPPRPSSLVAIDSDTRRRLRGDLDAIVLTALRREPEQRYPSAEALCRDIEHHLAGRPIQARRAPMSLRARKFVARHRIGVSAAALLAIVAGAGVVATLWQARAAAREAQRAAAVTAFLTGIFRESEPSAARGARVTAREVLDRGAGRVARELAAQPDVQAEMLRIIGDLYRQLGLLDQAAPHLMRAVALATQVHGPSSRETAAALDRWGVLLWDRGEYQQAADVLEKALAMRRQLYGPRSEEVSASLGALASVYSDLDRSAQAERLHREAYEIDRTLFGEDSLVTATSLTNLAIKLEERGAYDEAATLQRRALDVRRRIGGADHPDVADSLLALGVLLSKRGDYAEAEARLQEAAGMGRRVLGADHPKVAQIMDNLATAFEHRGALPASQAAAREALDIRRRALEPSHPDLALSINNHAVTSFRLGFFEEALASFREAHGIFASALGADHNYTTTALANIGFTLRERGELTQAEEITRQALVARRRTRGGESQEVAQSLRNLGLILTDRGEWANAERTLVESVELSRRVYPADHPRLAETLVALGRLKLMQQQLAPAEAAFREALRIRLEKVGPASWQAAEARMYLGSALCVPDTARDAEALLEGAIEALARPGQPAWRVADARLHQGACLGRLGRRAQARELVAQSLQALLAGLGPRHYLTIAARRELAHLASP